MVDERIDIEITDKISPQPAKKLREIASSALEADSALDRLKASLAEVDDNALTRLATASAKLTSAHAKEVTALARLETARAKDKAAVASLTRAQASMTSATTRAAAEIRRKEAAELKAANATGILSDETQANTAITRVNTNAHRANNGALGQVSRNGRIAAFHMQNLAFQMQDIGVGLVSGQNPMTVLVQQGSQIAGIAGQAKTSISSLLVEGARMAGRMVVAFAPVIAGVAAAAAVLKLFSMDMTHADGTTFTMTDTLGAMATVLKEDIVEGFGIVRDAVIDFAAPFAPIFNDIMSQVKRTTNFIIGTWVGAFRVIKLIWDNFPTALRNSGVLAMNFLLDVIQDGINGITGVLDDFFDFLKLDVEAPTIDLSGFRVELDEAGVAFEAEAAAALESARAHDYLGSVVRFVGESYESYRTRVEAAGRANRAHNEALERQTELLDQLRDPMEAYKERLRDIQALHSRGRISAEEFNRAIQETALGDVGTLQDISDVFAEREDPYGFALAQLEDYHDQRLEMVEAFGALESTTRAEFLALQQAEEANHADAVLRLQQETQRMQLASASSGFAELATIFSAAAGEQSDLARTAFAISKAFAIAESIVSIQQSLAQAMKLPFPANIPAMASIAAQGASIISTIQGTQPGYRDGGRVIGPGGPRDDAIPANLSNGEYVINAEATRNNLSLLEAINSNRRAPARGYASGGRVSSSTTSKSTTFNGGDTTTTNSSGVSIANTFDFSNTNFGNLSPDEVKALVENAVSKSMVNVYVPRILGQARETANKDMTQRFMRKSI